MHMFSRMFRFANAIFNSLMGKAESQTPVALLEQTGREMLQGLRALQESTATLIAHQTRTKREWESHNQKVKMLELQAEEALKQGSEKLARHALELHITAKAMCDRAEQTYKSAKIRAKNAVTKLEREKERIEPKLRRLGELQTINAMNEAQEKIFSMQDIYNIDGAMSVFDKTAAKIQEQTDHISAIDSLPVSESQELDKQLSSMSQKTEVDQAFEELKARLAGQTSGSGTDAKEEFTIKTKTGPAVKEKMHSAFDGSGN